MIYDTYYQITQFYPRGDEVRAELWAVPGRRAYAQFSDHHPIFDTLLLVLTKKTGIYIVIPTMVVYAVVYRRVWWRSLVPAALSVALMWGVMPNVVFPALDVVPGGRQEMLGTLFQQTARYVALHGVEMSASERRAIDDVLVVDTLNECYQP